MRAREVTQLLDACAHGLEGMSTEVGLRGDAVYLRVAEPSREDDWAVISSPGDRWFSLEVAGGYSLDHFEEETSDRDARRILEEHGRVAHAYLRSRPAPTPVGRCGRSALTVEAESGPVVLRKSLAGDVRDLLRWRRQSARRRSAH